LGKIEIKKCNIKYKYQKIKLQKALFSSEYPGYILPRPTKGETLGLPMLTRDWVALGSDGQ
jgi:hypothetical protein